MSEAHPDRKSSTVVYAGRVFTVHTDEVAYPDGRFVKMDIVRHPGSVVLVPMIAPDRVLLVRQYRYAVNQWLWELPAGTRDPGEAPEETALRECHEEVGRIAGRIEKLVSLLPAPGFCDEEMHFFRVTELRDRRTDEPEAHQDADELMTVKEFTLEAAREMVRKGEIVDMKTAIGLTLV